MFLPKFLQITETFKSDISAFLKKYALYIIPMLNPDGAKRYSRENENGIDLNRDALNLTQKLSGLVKKS